MNEISQHIPNESPDAVAHRLLQKAHNRDGLPEIAVGFCFLSFAVFEWLQIAFHPGSLPNKIAVLCLLALFLVSTLGSPWAIKQVRRRFLIEKLGYVKLKRLNRKWTGKTIGIALFSAAVSAYVVSRQILPHVGLTLAITGIGAGLLTVLCGRSPRFVASGVAMAAIGIVLGLQHTSLEAGFAILFGSMGLLSLVSGWVVFMLFLRQPAEMGE